ncbi:MAG: GNAT family N-acetyltransferase [Armatimonadetes bacterium]|nr:GNAT family N-acetyltransferase [Armatimonadota bacterium]
MPPGVRPYSCEDEASLVAAWNAALPLDPIDIATFRRKVLLDPNFDPSRLLVTGGIGDVTGFCLLVMRRVALEGVGLESGRAWITAMGVRPAQRGKGLGSALLERATQLCRETGCSQVSIAPYAPNYFVPGVDLDGYSDGLRFLLAREFVQVADAISMDANIVLLDTAAHLTREPELAAAGIRIGALDPSRIPALMAMLQEHMPGDWVRHARELLIDASRGHASYDQFTVAEMNGEVIGYCQYEGEHFGPFGVRDDFQGRGIGTVLLAKCLEAMRRAGHHNAWVLWTSEDTARKVYNRFGFKVTRRFAILRRELR